MDFVREILLKIDADPELDGTMWLRYDTPEEMGYRAILPKNLVITSNCLSKRALLKVRDL